ncbi:unnamed protein product, partial [Protopolystoma xenopodis]
SADASTALAALPGEPNSVLGVARLFRLVTFPLCPSGPGSSLDSTWLSPHPPFVAGGVGGGHSAAYLPLLESAAASFSALSGASCSAIYGGPQPASSAVIDAAIDLFGLLFPAVPGRHRLQVLDHCADCIRLSKSTRQEAIQCNVIAALLIALRRLAETKSSFGEDTELRKSTINLIFVGLLLTLTSAIVTPNQLLRCAAGECLGRLAQVVGETRFLAELAQQSLERLRTLRDSLTRAGHCLALGCLHRYVGGLASGQHLSTSVGVLLSIAQDTSAPAVQVWALHALTLTADSGGPMFRDYVEPSLSLVLQMLLRSPSGMTEIHHCLARLLGVLIITLGPELQGKSAKNISPVVNIDYKTFSFL